MHDQADRAWLTGIQKPQKAADSRAKTLTAIILLTAAALLLARGFL
jgi:hypothetical protein